MKRLKGEIERMKKVMKRVITACLAFAMILALVTPASVEAATKNESLTLYKGETYTWYLTGVKIYLSKCVKQLSRKISYNRSSCFLCRNGILLFRFIGFYCCNCFLGA